MKTKISATLIATLLTSGVVYATNSIISTTTTAEVSTQQTVQTVTAYYYNRGVCSMLIRVQGNYVVAYCAGQDYQGRQIWDDIQPVKISRNNGGDSSTTSPEWYHITAQKKYRVRLGQLTIFF